MEKATQAKEAAATSPGWPEPEPEQDSPEAVAFQSGVELLEAERWDEAKAAFLSALEQGDQRISRCHNGIGLSLSLPESASNEDLEAALESFEKAMKVAPENYRAWHNRAHTLERLGRASEAQEME